MPSPVPAYDRAATPQRAVPLAPVDAGAVLRELQHWSETSNRQLVAEGVRTAERQGLLSGAAAGATRGPVPLGRDDTEAGRAFTTAARAAWYARIETDAQETAADLARAWDAGEYGDDLEQWTQGLDAAAQGLLKGADEETRAAYGPRVAAVLGRTRQSVAAKHLERTQGQQRAQVWQGLVALEADALKAAADGDLAASGQTLGLYRAQLQSAVAGRLFTAEEAAKAAVGLQEKTKIETYAGDLRDAKDRAAWLAAFRKNRPGDLTPEQHEALTRRLEQWHSQEVEKGRLAQAQAEEDRIVALGLDPAAARGEARKVADPAVRALVEERVDRRLRLDEADRKTAREAASVAWWSDFGPAPTQQKLDALMLDPQVPPEEKLQARRYLEHDIDRQRAEADRREVKGADWHLFATISEQSTGDPAALAKRNLWPLKPQLGPLFDNALALQRSAANELRRRDEQAEVKAEHKAVVEAEQAERTARAQVDDVVKATARSLGLNPSAKPGSEAAAQYGRLYEQVYRWADTAKPKTRQEIQNYVDRALLKGEVDRPLWFDKPRFAFELAEDEAARWNLDGLPGAELPAMIEALEERGQRVTRENLLKLWEAKRGKR